MGPRTVEQYLALTMQICTSITTLAGDCLRQASRGVAWTSAVTGPSFGPCVISSQLSARKMGFIPRALMYPPKQSSCEPRPKELLCGLSSASRRKGYSTPAHRATSAQTTKRFVRYYSSGRLSMLVNTADLICAGSAGHCAVPAVVQ